MNPGKPKSQKTYNPKMTPLTNREIVEYALNTKREPMCFVTHSNFSLRDKTPDYYPTEESYRKAVEIHQRQMENYFEHIERLKTFKTAYGQITSGGKVTQNSKEYTDTVALAKGVLTEDEQSLLQYKLKDGEVIGIESIALVEKEIRNFERQTSRTNGYAKHFYGMNRAFEGTIFNAYSFEDEYGGKTLNKFSIELLCGEDYILKMTSSLSLTMRQFIDLLQNVDFSKNVIFELADKSYMNEEDEWVDLKYPDGTVKRKAAMKQPEISTSYVNGLFSKELPNIVAEHEAAVKEDASVAFTEIDENIYAYFLNMDASEVRDEKLKYLEEGLGKEDVEVKVREYVLGKWENTILNVVAPIMAKGYSFDEVKDYLKYKESLDIIYDKNASSSKKDIAKSELDSMFLRIFNEKVVPAIQKSVKDRYEGEYEIEYKEKDYGFKRVLCLFDPVEGNSNKDLSFKVEKGTKSDEEVEGVFDLGDEDVDDMPF